GERTNPERTKIYLHGPRAGTIANTGGIRRDCRSSESRRLICARERYRADRSWRANLQSKRPTQWTASSRSRLLSVAGKQRGESSARCAQIDGRSKAAFPGRHGLRRRARPNTLGD